MPATVTPRPTTATGTGASDAERVESGDAHQTLVLDHLWLADAMARRFQGRGEDDEDLRQVARCGLLDAAARYDPQKGQFAAFASATISGTLKRHFRDRGWTVRPPRHTQQLALEINHQWSDVAQECRSLPSDHDLASGLGAALADIREARRAAQGYRTVSIDSAPVPPAITAVGDAELERCEAKLLIEQAWQSLDRTEQDLLRMRFWEERSQSDIAQRIGTSQMQVSRLLTRALTHIREVLAIQPPVSAA